MCAGCSKQSDDGGGTAPGGRKPHGKGQPVVVKLEPLPANTCVSVGVDAEPGKPAKLLGTCADLGTVMRLTAPKGTWFHGFEGASGKYRITVTGGPLSKAGLHAELVKAFEAELGIAITRVEKKWDSFFLVGKPARGKLKRVRGVSPDSWMMGMEGMARILHRFSMDRFCEYLSENLEQPVINKTDLGGYYDFRLDVRSANPAGIIEAVEALGL